MTTPMFATHGYGAYSNGCRCDECKAAKREYMRRKRHDASAARRNAGVGYVAKGITHGTYSGYQDAYCRCYLCSAAKSDRDHRGARR